MKTSVLILAAAVGLAMTAMAHTARFHMAGSDRICKPT
jgi:hypothetical protein